MVRRNEDQGPPSLGWGCLVVAVIAVGAAIMFAVIFAWDVNLPH